MFFKRYYKYIFLLILFVIVYRPFLFFGSYEIDESAGTIFLSNMFGGSYSREKIEIVLSVTSLFGVVIINILFGDYIARDYLINSEYIFTRENNKGKWFLKKAAGLGLYSLLGMGVYVGTYVIGAITKSRKGVTVEDITVMVLTFIMMWELVFVTTLLINIISLKVGASISFIIVYSILIVSEMITFCMQSLPGNALVRFLHHMNPMSNITISWNYSTGNVYWSVFYFATLIFIVLLIGYKITTGYEFGIREVTNEQ
jgi:hypothetical protein